MVSRRFVDHDVDRNGMAAQIAREQAAHWHAGLRTPGFRRLSDYYDSRALIRFEWQHITPDMDAWDFCRPRQGGVIRGWRKMKPRVQALGRRIRGALRRLMGREHRSAREGLIRVRVHRR